LASAPTLLQNRAVFIPKRDAQTMIIVPTYLGQSGIHGLGVFAREPIAKGSKVWEYNPLFDLTLTEEQFEALPASVRAEIEIHLYQPEAGGPLYYESTMGKYMNHDREPNVDFSDVGVGWATRDIGVGEELTCDYRHFMAETGHIDYL
jgi:SET domain-containing protein